MLSTIRKTGAEGSLKAPALIVCSVTIIVQTTPAQTTETATITATLLTSEATWSAHCSTHREPGKPRPASYLSEY